MKLQMNKCYDKISTIKQFGQLLKIAKIFLMHSLSGFEERTHHNLEPNLVFMETNNRKVRDETDYNILCYI